MFKLRVASVGSLWLGAVDLAVVVWGVVRVFVGAVGFIVLGFLSGYAVGWRDADATQHSMTQAPKHDPPLILRRSGMR